jgi:hypothetical protein
MGPMNSRILDLEEAFVSHTQKAIAWMLPV